MRTTNHRRRGAGMAAAGMSAALVLSACGGGGDGGDDGEAEAVDGGGTVSAHNCEPQNLQPGNSTENCGSRILDQLYTGLTQVDYSDDVEVVPGVAESWESDDNVTWTLELSDEYTFHNGDPVDANTFVESWNWVVDPDNAQQGASFFDKIAGFQDVVDGDADELEGVTAVDDHTLEIELEEPFGQLPQMLTYSAFYPMPSEAFEDMDAFQDAPIGNGRYEMDGEWVRDTEINMNRYEDWPGEDPGKPERIEWQIYSDTNTAYQDVQAGNLDLLGEVPPNRIENLEDDFGDNFERYQTSRFVYMGLPTYDDDFADADMRRALSMALDRDELNEELFDGTYTPARSILPPTIPQGREDACGENCEFDADAAAELYEEAGGPSELTLWTDTGVGNEEYVEALANQWQQNLGIDSVDFEMLEFAQYLDLLEEEDIGGPYRLGWLLAYPSPQYAMEPLYTSGAPSNRAGYASEEFDSKIDEANRADEGEEADGLYQEAEDILLEDMPVIPLWFQDYFVVHSDRVEDAEMDLRTYITVDQVTVTEE
ncbi:MAG: ABC transporter substrate-binding protein [Nesterenkonia sp.]|uniref:peptide ABC transporter substrate-binding protein n=1 Tax=Nesterenkonia marinintestina TaxID=2979865 RepID=UPI0021C0E1B6|nr:ABC transporter substrate-binding protein [Nesterenkonia sp. GX14115]MDO5493120.1 ABC transporter substrate-binding protein [Nesterenkonia sp.]